MFSARGSSALFSACLDQEPMLKTFAGCLYPLVRSEPLSFTIPRHGSRRS
jgi:hypothetical protein